MTTLGFNRRELRQTPVGLLSSHHLPGLWDWNLGGIYYKRIWGREDPRPGQRPASPPCTDTGLGHHCVHTRPESHRMWEGSWDGSEQPIPIAGDPPGSTVRNELRLLTLPGSPLRTPRTSYLTLGFSLLICKMEITKHPAHRVSKEMKRKTTHSSRKGPWDTLIYD